jgi:hypothetical protein
MIRLRATKYDPSKRDSQGHYTVNEFASARDVGKVFGDHTLTAEDYVFVEDSYVACVKRLLDLSHVDSRRVTELEDTRAVTPVVMEVERLRPAAVATIFESMVVSGDEIEKIVRMALRERVWCKLSGKYGTYIHFGYDYYMYVGNTLQITSLGRPPEGMFYEEMESPYET